jgi:hypothetical protein
MWPRRCQPSRCRRGRSEEENGGRRFPIHRSHLSQGGLSRRSGDECWWRGGRSRGCWRSGQRRRCWTRAARTAREDARGREAAAALKEILIGFLSLGCDLLFPSPSFFLAQPGQLHYDTWAWMERKPGQRPTQVPIVDSARDRPHPHALACSQLNELVGLFSKAWYPVSTSLEVQLFMGRSMHLYYGSLSFYIAPLG